MATQTVIIYELRTAEVEVEADSVEEAERLVAQDVVKNHHDGMLAGVDHWELEDDGVTTNPSKRRSYWQVVNNEPDL